MDNEETKQEEVKQEELSSEPSVELAPETPVAEPSESPAQ